MGLGNKFEDVLTDIANQPDERLQPLDKQPGSNTGFQPLAGLRIGPVRKDIKPEQFPANLQAVEGFPDAIADRFVCDRGLNWCDAKEDRLQIKSRGGNNVFHLEDKEFRLTPGSAVSLTTSLGSGMRGEVSVGFSIDGMRIALRPSSQGIELIVRDRGKEARTDLVSKVETDSAKSTLLIVRDGKDKDSVQWYLKTGQQTQTGQIGATALGDDAMTSLFIAAPKKDMPRPLWVAELMIREGEE